MAFDYNRLRTQTAEPLLARFGRSAVLVKPGEPTGPPYDPQPGPPDESPVIIVETEFKFKDMDGTLIQVTDKMFLMSTSAGVEPENPDTFYDDDETFQVIQAKRLKPGPLNMLWKVHARR